MRRALALARRARGRVEPNPMVGCVIVKRDRIIGEGYHRKFGGPHAEVDALRRCAGDPRGATVYVTLEPCAHTGKTPPCVDALIAARVGRVVAAGRDPNPAVRGRGFRKLRAAGIDVTVGVARDEAQQLNAPFFKLMRTGQPWVIAKWAQSLDGKIATHTGDSKWISDQVARGHAHRERGRVDGILVGVGTVLRDDPALTARVGRPKRTATRIVLDPQLRTPLKSQLVRTARRTPTLIVCSERTAARTRGWYESRGCVVLPLPHAKPAGLDLDALLTVLGERQMSNLIIEGGGATLGHFFDQQRVDEIHCYLTPQLIGGATAPGPWHTHGVTRVREALPLPANQTHLKKLGTGWLVTAKR